MLGDVDFCTRAGVEEDDAVSFNFIVQGVPIFTDLRGYFEFGTENRTKGGSVFLTVNVPLSAPAKGNGT